MSSVERYLKKHRYCEPVVTGHSFARTRETLKSKGNKPFRRNRFFDPRRDRNALQQPCFWLQALINTLWYNNCLHFGLRGGKEQRELKWGDLVLKKDTESKEYV